MKTVFCVAAESTGSGMVDWWSTPQTADQQMKEMREDQSFCANTLSRFNLQVPLRADTGDITDMVDNAMWQKTYSFLSRRIGTDKVHAIACGLTQNATVNAVDLFGAPKMALAQLFKTTVLAAMGARVMQGGSPLAANGDNCADISFYPNEMLWLQVFPGIGSPPRMTINFFPKDDLTNESARCTVEMWSMARLGNPGPGPLFLTVVFPDQMLGLNQLTLRDSGLGTYRGLYFNTTPGVNHSNLFEVINSISEAFAQQLTAHLMGEPCGQSPEPMPVF